MTAGVLERRFRQEARRRGVPRDAVEKDFALSYALAGIFGVQQLAATLVFKGGTALRKGYFADYRYSEDLDFTAVGELSAEALEAAVAIAREGCRDLLLTKGSFDVTTDRYPIRGEHPGGQRAFRLHIQFPWQRRPLCSIKIEVTLDESVLLPPVVRPLIHDFDEPLSATMRCYALEEIVAEKLRALLQTKAHLDQRGWARPRARDYFDLWQLLVHRGVPLDRATVGAVLPQKCRVRGVDFVTAADFFAATVIERARLDWSQDLPRLAADMPGFDRCLSDLRPQIEQIVALR